MPSFAVAQCTVDDAAALAANNMSAFWTDSTWVLIWTGKTRDHVISQATRRMPWLLLSDPQHRRQQKAVDRETGAVVGYIRWLLPDGCADDLWPEALVPRVDDERAREAEREFKEADWNYNDSTSALDVPVTSMKKRLMEGKSYLVLDYLAVRPDHRNQGIASMLVDSGVREAEKMGLDAFVLAYKAGLGVYLRAGFELLDQVIQDDTKYGGKGEWECYCLEKKAAKHA